MQDFDRCVINFLICMIWLWLLLVNIPLHCFTKLIRFDARFFSCTYVGIYVWCLRSRLRTLNTTEEKKETWASEDEIARDTPILWMSVQSLVRLLARSRTDRLLRSIHFHLRRLKQKRNGYKRIIHYWTESSIKRFGSIGREGAYLHVIIVSIEIVMKNKKSNKTLRCSSYASQISSFRFDAFLISFTIAAHKERKKRSNPSPTKVCLIWCLWMQKFIKMIALFGTIDIHR